MGPLSDRFGRRPVMLAGLALTAAASVLAISVGTVGSLIVARVLQALRRFGRHRRQPRHHPRSVRPQPRRGDDRPRRHRHGGGADARAADRRLARHRFGWEAIFLFTAVTSAMVVAWAAIALPETRGLNAPPGAQQGFFRDLASLARSAKFVGYVCAGAFGSATFFAFLGGGAHVIITLMERSSAEYGVWFAICSIGYMAGNFGASRLSTRFGIDRMIWWGIGFEVARRRAVGRAGDVRDALGAGHRVRAATDRQFRQRPAAARRDRGRGQRARRRRPAPPPASSASRRWRSAPRSPNTPARCLRNRDSAVPLALLMVVLVAALTISFALLVRRT